MQAHYMQCRTKPVTYSVAILHGVYNGQHIMSFILDFSILGAFCVVLFALSLRNIKQKWIALEKAMT
jgi:ABC-2 type transport system permease protein